MKTIFDYGSAHIEELTVPAYFSNHKKFVTHNLGSPVKSGGFAINSKLDMCLWCVFKYDDGFLGVASVRGKTSDFLYSDSEEVAIKGLALWIENFLSA